MNRRAGKHGHTVEVWRNKHQVEDLWSVLVEERLSRDPRSYRILDTHIPSREVGEGADDVKSTLEILDDMEQQGRLPFLVCVNDLLVIDPYRVWLLAASSSRISEVTGQLVKFSDGKYAVSVKSYLANGTFDSSHSS